MDSKIVKTERFDINMMDNLASHDGVSVDVKKQLKAYKKMRENGNVVQVVYEYGKDLKKLQIGRLYPQKGLGLQNFPSDVRAALAEKYYHDIDMVNSQPTLLAQICEKNGWKCDHLNDYVENRARYLEEIMKHNNCDRDAAKTLCISIMFGAKPEQAPKSIMNLVTELDKISTNIAHQNPDVYALCKKKPNPKASCLANILQDKEFQILRLVDTKLQERGRVMDVYIHDGGLVRRVDDEKEFPVEMLKEISEQIKEETGYSITLAEKPIRHTFEFKKDVMRMMNVTEQEYQKRKEEFEENHFYHNETGTICTEHENGLTHTSKTDARATFASYSFQKTVDNTKKTISFIAEWINDPLKRVVNRFVFNPDLKQELKEDEYNLFRGFAGSRYEGQVDEKEKDKIIERFKILVEQNAGSKPELIEYMTKWFAHMVQKPKEAPGVALILINKEHGTGKDTLGNLIGQKVIGADYFKNIINVETQLFDSHSTAFDKTIFMKLEEVNGQANRKFADMLKSMITSTTAEINPKGMKKYTIEAYPHIMMTTNNTVPVKIEPNDRRYCVSYTSSDYKGNREFWKETVRLFNLPEAGAVVYNYLKEIDLTGFDVQEFPKTSYHESLSLSETPSEELFLKNGEEEFMDLSASALHEIYFEYCLANHLPPKNLISFSRALSPLLEIKIIKRRMKDGRSLYSGKHNKIHE
jgi:hypothetical protein